MSKCPSCEKRISLVRILSSISWKCIQCNSCGNNLELSRGQCYLFAVPFLVVILGIRLVPWFGFGLDIRGGDLWALYFAGGVIAYGISALLVNSFATFNIRNNGIGQAEKHLHFHRTKSG